MKDKFSFILDSGAFSAWTRKSEIDINAYISYILENDEYIDYIVNLDVIPGEWGRVPTKEESEKACLKGFYNYYYMIDNGINKDKLIHVFHQGDDYKYLKKMMRECTDYIGISPANDKNTTQKISWLDEVFSNYICNEKGIPQIRTHGFGVTSFSILFRYPWYSVDSTTWVMCSQFGQVIVPKYENEKFIYSEPPRKLDVSLESPRRKKENMHFDNISKREKEIVLLYLERKGYKLEELQSDYLPRWKINIQYYLDLQKIMIPYSQKRFIRKEKGFFI
jgi:hypothetical protein